MTKRVSIRDIIEGIRKDGLRKVKGRYLSYYYPPPIFGSGRFPAAQVQGGCALGQAAVNLGINPKNFDMTTLPVEIKSLVRLVVNYNDETDMTLPEIADLLEPRFEDSLDVSFEAFERDYIIKEDAKV